MNTPSPKRKRLSYACNHCRQKKTRCDEHQPSCRNCQLAGVECITTDKRRSGAPVSHRRRTLPTPSSDNNNNNQPSESPVQSPVALAPPPTAQQHARVWPQCWDRAGWRSGRLPMMPRFVGTSMLELMTEWLDLAFYRLRIPLTGFASVAAAKEPEQVIVDRAPDLPPLGEVKRYVRVFRDTLHQLVPFLADKTVDQCGGCVGTDVPKQAIAYLVITAGLMASTASEQSRALVCPYMGYCNTLLGHLVARRCLESVQAILLFAVVIRSCDRIAWAWDVLALGVSMAQSLGINQNHFQPRSDAPEHDQGTQTWWCMYVFEKILAFESGRPSMIWDRELSQTTAVDDSVDADEKYRRAAISLANILHEIQERSARTWRREEWLPQTVDEAIEEKIRTGGELAVLLADWYQGLPAEFRSASTSPLNTASQSAFLSFYYYHAIILLNRSTLLIDRPELREMIHRYGSGKPWHHRLSNGPSVCIEAAREMIKLLVTLTDSSIPNYLSTLTSPLAAAYALVVHIVRERSSLLSRSDFELMKAAMELTRQHYGRHSIEENVGDILLALEKYTSDCLDGVGGSSVGGLAMGPSLSALESSGDLDMSSMSLGVPWGPSALDWVGWDWNDVSHLFAHGE